MSTTRLTGYSTALFATWYFLEELGILFDAGDGLTAHLLQKSRKIKYVFISHADRDHLTGLLQFNQLNARPDFPQIHYPKDCGSFPKLEEFSKLFDPHIAGTQWFALDDGQEVWIAKDLVVQGFRNGHVVGKGDTIKSLSYHVFRVKRKLKEEYLALDGNAVRLLRQEKGEEAITDEVRDCILSYSGDCPVENDGRWANSQTLIHEATFLRQSDLAGSEWRGNRHSSLDAVLQMAAQLKSLKRLVLGHFSSRYSAAEIQNEVQRLCELYSITIPVHLVLPGVCASYEW